MRRWRATYGTADDVALFTQRAGSWRNLLDPSSNFLRPRMSDGSWANPTSLGVTNTWDPDFSDGWQEGTGWQYLWLVPQDVRGLASAIGESTFTQRLDEFFSQPANSWAAPAVPLAQQQASFFGVYYAGTQPLAESLGDRSTSAFGDADRRSDPGCDQHRVPDRLEGDEEDAIGKIVGYDRSELDRQPGLAGAARSGEGQKAGGGEKAGRLRQPPGRDRRTS